VTILIHNLPLAEINTLSLAQLINVKQTNVSFPLTFQFSNQHLAIDSRCEISNIQNQTTDGQKSSKTSDIELVVFSETKIQQLFEMTKKCQLTLQELTAINHRNGLISYRFSVDCNDLVQARANLAAIGLAEKIEMALIKQAPLLTQPGVLVMDMDSTTIEIECIDEIAVLAGVGEQVAAVTEQAMQGELDFAQSLHQRVATLTGSPESILTQVADNLPLMNGLESLITQLKQYNWRIAIASGGFTYFADHLKQMLNLDAAHANVLEIKDHKLTGKVLGDVVDAQAKADCLLSLQQQYQIASTQTVAMGDGANDLVMMQAAHLGVAFHAKPIVLKQADSSINFSGLDCLVHWLA